MYMANPRQETPEQHDEPSNNNFTHLCFKANYTDTWMQCCFHKVNYFLMYTSFLPYYFKFGPFSLAEIIQLSIYSNIVKTSHAPASHVFFSIPNQNILNKHGRKQLSLQVFGY